MKKPKETGRSQSSKSVSKVKRPQEIQTSSPEVSPLGAQSDVQSERLLVEFQSLSPKSRADVLRYIARVAVRDQAAHQLEAPKPREPKVLEEWKDANGATIQFVESRDDGLTPEQRLDAIAEILATLALRVVKQQKEEAGAKREKESSQI